MKVVLFCGGLGLRMREHSERIPKGMVPIGYRPIVWHVMRYYAHFGHREFILCLGYRADAFKRFFLSYQEALSNDFIFSDGGTTIELLGSDTDDWRISLVDTGAHATIAERLLAARSHLGDDEVFLANYADTLTDAPLDVMASDFLASDATAAFLSVRPVNYSFHVVRMAGDGRVSRLDDIRTADLWINGGYFMLRREILDEIQSGEELVVEPFARLADAGRLLAYRHEGFWAPLDTIKDIAALEEGFASGRAPWAPWMRNAG